MSKLMIETRKNTITATNFVANDEITTIVNRLVETVSPEKIYLFGSYARGDYNENSDYDFYVVVSDDTESVLHVIQNAYLNLLDIYKTPVDIVGNTVSRFKELSALQTLERTVKNEGVLLYE